MNQEKTNTNNKLVIYLITTATDPLWDAVREYCLTTELYDRSFMTGRVIRGEILPGNAQEMYQSSRFAEAEFSKLKDFTWLDSKQLKGMCRLYENSQQYGKDLDYLL
jgi:hypothetical protein